MNHDPQKRVTFASDLVSENLTKREYFAALALPALITNADGTAYATVAVFAVQVADALIAALNAAHVAVATNLEIPPPDVDD